MDYSLNMIKTRNNLIVKDLWASVGEKEVLKGVNLEVGENKVQVLMGPNGSGKSSLANTLMGHPAYRVTRGEINFYGKNITQTSVEDRAKMGLFLAFQHPLEIQV